MLVRRYSKRVNLTIDMRLLRIVDMRAQEFRRTRSGILREALWTWVRAHPTEQREPQLLVNGQPFDPNKLFKDYITHGTANTNVLAEYEAAYTRWRKYRD